MALWQQDDIPGMRIALVVILLVGVAFGYREISQRNTSPHDQAVASLKRMIGMEATGDAGSVTCNTNPTPEPPGYAAYGHLTMFDCSYDSTAGRVVHTCMMKGGGELDQLSHGQWGTDGEGTCAAAGKMLSTLMSGGVPLPATT